MSTNKTPDLPSRAHGLVGDMDGNYRVVEPGQGYSDQGDQPEPKKVEPEQKAESKTGDAKRTVKNLLHKDK